MTAADRVREVTEVLTVGSTLTAQEIQAAYLSHYDFGPGYPQLPVSRHITNLYLDDTIETISLKFAPEWTPAKQRQVDDDLREVIARFLPLPRSRHIGVECTFSGSIALDRALTAAVDLASTHKSSRLAVVTTSPCIDIMKLFLEERRFLEVRFVESRAAEPWALDPDGLINAVRSLTLGPNARQVIVLLSSPENPTGQSWSAENLQAIYQECLRVGAVLVIDHAFLVAGVHDEDAVCPVWQALDAEADWIAAWDTGKTFGLNEDKLGFLITGSHRAHSAVLKSLGVLQFGVARRQKLFFAELLRRATYLGHVDSLREICRRNLDVIEELSLGSVVTPIRPEAGSVMLLRLPTDNDEAARSHLLKTGVGVVRGNVFFHTAWQPQNLIRVALAREPAYFRQGFQKLLAELQLFYT